MANKELPPGPTWDEALAVIRQHDAKTADWLDHEHWLHRWGIGSRENRTLVILEAEALGLYKALDCLKVVARMHAEALGRYEKLRQEVIDGE